MLQSLWVHTLNCRDYIICQLNMQVCTIIEATDSFLLYFEQVNNWFDRFWIALYIASKFLCIVLYFKILIHLIMHKITGNEVSAISSHSHSHIRILLCFPVDKSYMQFIPYSIVYMFLTMTHMHVNFFIFTAVYI